jgi:hypothetical protein
MFRKGGSVGEGIMSKVEPRQGYQVGNRVKSIYEQIAPLYTQAMQTGRDDTISNLLIRGGLNLVGGSDKDEPLLRQVASAYKQPTEVALKEVQQRRLMEPQAKLAALGAATKIAGAKTARPLKAQTIEGQVENYYSNIARTASRSQLEQAYALRPQITKAFRSGVSPRIAPTNMKGDSIDTSFFKGKPDGFLYINPITGAFERVFNERPFRRIDQNTLQPITTGE